LYLAGLVVLEAFFEQDCPERLDGLGNALWSGNICRHEAVMRLNLLEEGEINWEYPQNTHPAGNWPEKPLIISSGTFGRK
jgi:hypothetical protein